MVSDVPSVATVAITADRLTERIAELRTTLQGDELTAENRSILRQIHDLALARQALIESEVIDDC